MAITHKITQTLNYSGLGYTTTKTKTGGQENNLSESIPDSSTDLEVAWAVDISELKALLIVADGALTVKTNSSSTPDDTFTLVVNTPIVWEDANSSGNPLSADVTSIFVTNSSGGAVTLTTKALTDPTP